MRDENKKLTYEELQNANTFINYYLYEVFYGFESIDEHLSMMKKKQEYLNTKMTKRSFDFILGRMGIEKGGRSHLDKFRVDTCLFRNGVFLDDKKKKEIEKWIDEYIYIKRGEEK